MGKQCTSTPIGGCMGGPSQFKKEGDETYNSINDIPAKFLEKFQSSSIFSIKEYNKYDWFFRRAGNPFYKLHIKYFI